VDDVVVWLASLGLAEHQARFRQDAVDGRRLAALDRAALIGLGVTQLEHRRTIERAVTKALTSASTAAAVGNVK
jgi:hypothetical protein